MYSTLPLEYLKNRRVFLRELLEGINRELKTVPMFSKEKENLTNGKMNIKSQLADIEEELYARGSLP